MPQVPYKPIPDATPSGQGLPTVGVSTPVAAFGGAMAQAVEHLGGVEEKAGNEVFARALALQQLKNETEAKEADTQYMIQVGKLHAEFGSLKGKAAVDAQDQYFKNIDDLRVRLRGNLSNDMARRMFDSSALSTMGRTIFNGAGHAAAENKHWVAGTAHAQNELDSQVVENDPSPAVFQEKLRKTKENMAVIAATEGYEPDGAQERNLQFKAESQLWSRRFTGLARTSPWEARVLLDANKDKLTETDFLRVDNIVRGQSRSIGSARLADEIYDPGLSLKEMEEQVRARAKELDPKDPILAQHAVAAIQGKYNQDKYARTRENQENWSVINEGIKPGIKTEQELRASDPKVAKAMDDLPPERRNQIPGLINRMNAARDKITNQDAEQTVRGLRENDVEQFINADLTQYHLGYPDLKKWQTLQSKLKESPNTDPRLSKAIGWIRRGMGSQLQALGIYNRTGDNQEDYDHYVGALGSAIDLWVENHGKSPDSQQILKEIAPQVIFQQIKPGRWWGTNAEDPFFKQDMYKTDESKKWVEDYKAQIFDETGSEPTEEQVYRVFIRAQLNSLHDKKNPGDHSSGP